MFVIRVFCNQGMSTSLVVNKMREAAKKAGEEADIAAFPINEIESHIKDADCVLLGPQVGYMKAKTQSFCQGKGIPADVIPMVDYGMCNGENIYKFAKKLAGK